ncbi:DUF4395 domain-containing protein [Mucilaginibacter sp. RB4R14]|uniref:DUF4395 domain-containing protein n=1 Tax=Mucilaginibacter aurantiaciroseus TaxID=2949308 RepID=UPI00209181BB|nr:DUF4395 domain-containing protein [Mucilaginibacter aurantiaciroseus]MCO5934584.1 DUF4395 domain-containing protein [Mucilaginibacter aurantiaciroseus]
MNNDLQCPVDHVKVNENKVRMIALLVLVLGLFFLFTSYSLLIILLVFDFFTRTFNKQKHSPLGWLADRLVFRFKIPYKPTDRGPKRFAAGMGLTFVSIILIATIAEWAVLLLPLTVLLCIFAFLESFSGFCVGCYVYTGLQWVMRKFGRG